MDGSASTYELALSAHSILRWLVILLLALALVRAFGSMLAGAESGVKARLLGVGAMIALDLQLLLGLALHFWLSPNTRSGMQDMGAAMKDPVQRFWVVEHGATMLLAVVVVHAGRAWAKKAKGSRSEDFRSFLTLAIGLALILLRTPWPFFAEGIARPWFPTFGG